MALLPDVAGGDPPSIGCSRKVVDVEAATGYLVEQAGFVRLLQGEPGELGDHVGGVAFDSVMRVVEVVLPGQPGAVVLAARSEERRVGKECRCQRVRSWIHKELIVLRV